MTPQPSLDPRKSPWKRGDVCTLGFEKNCFVLNYTKEYLEVRWMSDGSVERIPAEAIDSLLRVAHADSLGPDGRRTNSQYLEASEALALLESALAERIKGAKSESEKKELNHLTRRIFAEDGCKWDKKNQTKLLALLAAPKSVGVIFKLRERIHRIFCNVGRDDKP
jgi:hypothetical protein